MLSGTVCSAFGLKRYLLRRDSSIEYGPAKIIVIFYRCLYDGSDILYYTVAVCFQQFVPYER